PDRPTLGGRSRRRYSLIPTEPAFTGGLLYREGLSGSRPRRGIAYLLRSPKIKAQISSMRIALLFGACEGAGSVSPVRTTAISRPVWYRSLKAGGEAVCHLFDEARHLVFDLRGGFKPTLK